MTKTIYINCLVLIGFLLILEGILKITCGDYFYYERTYAAKFPEKAMQQLDHNWVQKEPDLGWVCQQKKRLKFYSPAFDSINYQINQEGFRMDNNLATLPASPKKRILLLGDSFLFGIFLANEATITVQLQQYLGSPYEVFSLAIPGWGIDQMYQAYQKYAPFINPDQVVLLFIDDDIERTVESFFWGASTKTAYYLDDGKLVPRSPTHGRLNMVEAWFVFNFQIVNRLYHFWCKKEAERLSKAIIVELNAQEKQANRQLKCVRIPRREQVLDSTLQFYHLHDFFEENEVPFYDFQKLMSTTDSLNLKDLFIPNDDHPSEQGAQLIAKQLKELLQ